MAFYVPNGILETTLVVKKSEFHARAAIASNRNEALSLLAQCKKDYPDARHHCWAYLIGNPTNPETAAMSDDGEPSGTAGKPILNVLQHKNVGSVMVVVSRYFGGIKLGAGGLVRAYSGATQQTMEQLPVTFQEVLTSTIVKTEFKHEQYLRHFVLLNNGNVDDCYYSNGVTMSISLPQQKVQLLTELVASIQAQIINL